MLLYLVRHGEALAGEVDALRPLSEKGIKDAMKLAGFLKKNSIQPKTIFHSGLKRAQETAEIIAKGLERNIPVVIKDSLDPEDPVKPACDDVEKISDDVMIVGHLPFLSNMVSNLILGSEKEDLVEFKKGALVVLE